MINILILEDDKLFNETLQDFLEEEGFKVEVVLDPYSALELTYHNKYDLYLFDVNLPYENGFELLQKLRKSGDNTPTIFITSREDKQSLRDGFKGGGDDYLKKPIDLDELRLRIDAILRRQIRDETLAWGDFKFDIMSKNLTFLNKKVDLPIKSRELLYLLLENRGSVVHIDTIKERLWSSAKESSDGSLRVYITQLKKHFSKEIINIRGVGYMMSID